MRKASRYLNAQFNVIFARGVYGFVSEGNYVVAPGETSLAENASSYLKTAPVVLKALYKCFPFLIRATPFPRGRNNILCGSRASESALSNPFIIGLSSSTKANNPPKAPST